MNTGVYYHSILYNVFVNSVYNIYIITGYYIFFTSRHLHNLFAGQSFGSQVKDKHFDWFMLPAPSDDDGFLVFRDHDTVWYYMYVHLT